MLFSHRFFGLPLLFHPGTVPCMIVLARQPKMFKYYSVQCVALTNNSVVADKTSATLKCLASAVRVVRS